MLEIEWNNPRIELPKLIKLEDFPEKSIGDILVILQNQFYHTIKSYKMVNY